MSTTTGRLSTIGIEEYAEILETSEEVTERKTLGRTLIYQLNHPIYGLIILLDGGMTDEKAMIRL